MISIARLSIIRHCNVNITNTQRSYSTDSPKDVANNIINNKTESKSHEKNPAANSKSNYNAKDISRDIIKEFPKPPTNCCESGCANCVWVEYAERLTEYFKDGGENAIKEIEEKVQNEDLKVFILLEIEIMLKQKKKPPK